MKQKQSSSAKKPPKDVKVLIVDDDHEDFLLCKLILERVQSFNFEVHWEKDFDEGLKQVFKDVFDVCLIDYRIDKKNGVDFIREASMNGVWTPMIILTGMNDYDIDLDAMRAGASDYLVKDEIKPEILERSIRYALERQRISCELEEQSNLDPLTNLTNREGYKKTLQLEIQRAKETKDPLMVLFVDLDGFKQVNDTMGHQAGDQLLRKIAERLQVVMRQGDVIARYGGDEFILMLKEKQSVDHVEDIVRRMMVEIERPLLIQGRHVQVQCSVGGAIFPEHGDDLEKLIFNADAAMYQAKKSGGRDFKLHQNESNTHFMKRQLADGPDSIVKKDELFLVFQPQIDIQTCEIVGAEALLRRRKNDQVYLPKNFFQQLKETDQFIKVGYWVFEQVCAQLKVWNQNGNKPRRCSINCSAAQLIDPEIVQRVKQAFEIHQISPNQIEIEVSEETLEIENEAFKTNVTALHQLGIRFSLDGFGKSKASLTALEKMPLRTIKLDQSIVTTSLQSKRSKAIATAAMTFAKELGIEILAQGVESQAQYNFFKGTMCDKGQGFYFSKPLSSKECKELSAKKKNLIRVYPSS